MCVSLGLFEEGLLFLVLAALSCFSFCVVLSEEGLLFPLVFAELSYFTLGLGISEEGLLFALVFAALSFILVRFRHSKEPLPLFLQAKSSFLYGLVFSS